MNQGLSTSPTSVALPAYLYFNINENISYCQSCLEKYARLSFRSLTRSKTVVTHFPKCRDLPRYAPQVPSIPSYPTFPCHYNKFTCFKLSFKALLAFILLEMTDRCIPLQMAEKMICSVKWKFSHTSQAMFMLKQMMM